ncbi:MAG: ComF family protein [Anaerolineales bacterium]|nr:ComF family protein [Anaerolineales bacterium]
MVNVPRSASQSACFAACTICVRYPSLLDGMQAAVEFPGVIRKAIHALKYHGRRDLAYPLAELMADAWSENPFPVDLIIPVPLHPRRQRERGYNQSVLLAELFARHTGISFLSDGLIRWRMTESQTLLSSSDRRTNVAGAFKTNESANFQGLNVLLVDDVSTTGSTLQACAAALREKSIERVYALTVARAMWNPASGEMADAFPDKG